MRNSSNIALHLAVEAEIEHRRRARERAETASRLSFKDFVSQVNPRYKWYTHCEALAGPLQRVADGEIKRLMVFMPPRHSKSETVSRLFSAYFLYRHPQRWVGLASYSAELAYTLSRSARDHYRRIGRALKHDAAGVTHWETGEGGGLWAAGFGGSITGKGWGLGIIDDPLKNAEEAASDTIRSKHQDWYSSTFYTREEPWSETDPQSAMIVIQTRWHEEDLAGWLLSEESGDDPEKWHIVNLPAIAEDQPQSFPDTCTVEPDWRAPGEALCPDRRPIEKLGSIRSRIGDYYFDALFQQRPTAKEGEFFKMDKIEIVDAPPADLRRCRAWDLAATPAGGAFSCGVRIGVDSKGVYYVEDVNRGQWSADAVKTQLKSTAIADGVNVRIHLPQDPGQAGKDQAEQLLRHLAGFVVKAEPVTGSKENRAFSFAAQWNAGNVKLVKGPWNKAFTEELRQFPRGKYKDQVDSGSDAFTELALGGQFHQGQLVR